MPRLPIIVASFVAVSFSHGIASNGATNVPMIDIEQTLGSLIETPSPEPVILVAQNKSTTGPSKSPPKKTDNRNLPPPVLKEQDRGEPVHDVRKDVTYIPIEQLEALHERLRNPDVHSMGPKVVEREYDKLYRKLYAEREALVKAGLKMKHGDTKTATLRQAYGLSMRFDKLPEPSSAKEFEFKKWRPVYDTISGLEYEVEAIELATKIAGRAINSADKLNAYEWLVDLRNRAKSNRKKMAAVDEMVREFIDTGIFGLLYHFGKSTDVMIDIRAYKDSLTELESYIRDYEKALKRKWPEPEKPAENPQSLVPKVEPLPKIIEMVPETLVAPCNDVNNC